MNEEKSAAPGVAEQRIEMTEAAWQAHIARAAKFRGSNAEYCRRHDLDPKIFRSFKKKYAAASAPAAAAPKAFVQVERRPSDAAARAEARPATSAALPDARWIAEFLVALWNARR
jgi:hypothetical protein